MKILIATDGMDIGGAETHVFTLINELKRRGIDVTLISAGGPYADILEKSGVRCIKAPLNKRDPISIRRSKIALSKAMRQTDIVHAHTRFTAFIAKSIRGAAKYPKIVTTAHLNFPLFPFGAFAFWGDGTLAVSEDIREYLMTNYELTPKDVCLTKNALDVSAYQKARLDTKVIIHTSRIDTGRSKAAFLLVEAARDILSRHPDWRILIVGDGNRFARLIKKAKDNGFIVSYNHPTWSKEDASIYTNLEGLFAMEIYNNGAQLHGHETYCPTLYDEMLRSGQRIGCIATDDTHGEEDLFGGATYIYADELSYDAIITALEKGDFYASRGPEIKSLWYEDGIFYIECSPAKEVIISNSGRREPKKSIKRDMNGGITCAEFEINELDLFVRFTVVDKHGITANTRAYWREEFEESKAIAEFEPRRV